MAIARTNITQTPYGPWNKYTMSAFNASNDHVGNFVFLDKGNKEAHLDMLEVIPKYHRKG